MYGNKKRGGENKPPLLIPAIILFLMTRKEYKIPSMSFFIPNKSLISVNDQSSSMSSIDIARKIINNVTFSFTNVPQIGFLFGIKPIYGIDIPLKVWLPLDIPLAMPQILYKLRAGLIVKPVNKFGVLLGYNVHIPEITFYA